MARYIEKEPLCAWLENMGVSKYIIQSIQNEDKFPTADVAPKSEVDKLKLQLFDANEGVSYYKTNLIAKCEELENAKAEVAREIFEEIERLLREHSGYEILSDGKSLWYYEESLGEDIAELKKKYQEGDS